MSVRLPLGNNNDHQVIMAAGLQLTRQTVLLALGGITLPLLIPLAQVHRYLPFFNCYSPRPGWDNTTAADTAGAGTSVPTILQLLFSSPWVGSHYRC